MKQKKYEDALSSFHSAMEYPENLAVGKSTHDEMNAMVHSYIGNVCEKLNQKEKAKASCLKSVEAINSRNMSELAYF